MSGQDSHSDIPIKYVANVHIISELCTPVLRQFYRLMQDFFIPPIEDGPTIVGPSLIYGRNNSMFF
jgi:hypothetical protein